MRALTMLGGSLLVVLSGVGCLAIAGFDPKERVEAASEQDGGPDVDAPVEQDGGPDVDAPDEQEADGAAPDAPQDGQDEEVIPACGAGRTYISAGKFMMGGYGYVDQQPVHEVTLGAFCMSTTEVTVGQYNDCVTAKACASPDEEVFCNVLNYGRDDHPVNCVDLARAQQYCAWAKGKVPTEEQWEYAAKGPTTRLYPYGDEEPSAKKVCWSEDGTCVADKPDADRSYFGVAGMGANVSEWTTSPYCSYSNPMCGETLRVIRGGEWYNQEAAMVEAASRGSASAELSGSTVGFRCVWE